MKGLIHHRFNAVLAALTLTFMATAAESLSVLLQKAIYTEETEGDIEAAIKLYESIAKDGEANRSLVAQAQYRLGICQLKRGKSDDAEAAFRKITGQFADQSDVSAKARERLNEMGKSVSSVVVRQVWSGQEVESGSLSSDGRYLAFVDWESGNLAVRDFSTGQTRRLTSNASWERPIQYAESSAFSRDGKMIAYCWYGTNDSFALQIVSLENSKSRNLFAKGANGWLSAEDWSPDGKSIAVFDAEQKGTNSLNVISLINVADGAVRKLTEGEAFFTSTLRFSPDGRYLAYNRAPRFRAAGSVVRLTNDICVLDVQTGIGKVAITHFANEQFVGWGPRGHELVFSSERRGTGDIWLLRIEDGEAKGEPNLLKADLGKARPIGFSRNGSFFYGLDASYAEVRRARIDFATGKLLQPVETLPIRSTGEIITTRSGFRGDGRYLALLGERFGKKQFLSIFDLQTRQQWTLDSFQSFSERNTPIWVWDQSALLVRGVRENSGNGMYLIDRTTGTVTEAATETPGYTLEYVSGRSDPNPIFSFETSRTNRNRVLVTRHDLKSRIEEKWEFDLPGKRSSTFLLWEDTAIFYGQGSENPQEEFSAARRYDFKTGKTLELFRSKYPIDRVAPRQGFVNREAIVATRNASGQSIVTFISFTPDTVHERLAVTLPSGASLGWGTNDGHYLLFQKPVGADENSPSELWAISQDTGKMIKTELLLPADTAKPDVGVNDVIFLVRKSASPEVWVMENLLPPVALAK
jgi:Tol biopolymer transport system component